MKTLAELLHETNTTDAALAEKVGCDRSMITKVRLRKVTPSLTLALAIRRETGVALELLTPDTDASQGDDAGPDERTHPRPNNPSGPVAMEAAE